MQADKYLPEQDEVKDKAWVDKRDEGELSDAEDEFQDDRFLEQYRWAEMAPAGCDCPAGVRPPGHVCTWEQTLSPGDILLPGKSGSRIFRMQQSGPDSGRWRTSGAASLCRRSPTRALKFTS